ncbi:MAG: 4-hydroxy-3-methylbut-2-enyl diphosphate reductase [Legionellales bacterium]|jgi:4-hydroxy-3-methylbut-2-enyl diphosphate reductase
MKILLANPRGFCAGVDRAIEIVKRALVLFGAPVYVRHQIVHNRFVVKSLENEGAVFVKELSDVPDNSIVIFSAHGVAKQVHEEGNTRNLTVIDATCPLVTKVHMEVVRAARAGHECILIGHAGHPEVIGTMGHYVGNKNDMHLVEHLADVEKLQLRDPEHLYFVTQTTLSVDETKAIIEQLYKRFPKIQGPKHDDICYATQNRQDAVRKLAQHSDVLLVVGSENSSNSNRLRELAEHLGTPAYLLDSPDLLQKSWLENKNNIGITAGASAPEVLVKQIIARLKEWGADEEMVEITGAIEQMEFALPRVLRQTDQA